MFSNCPRIPLKFVKHVRENCVISPPVFFFFNELYLVDYKKCRGSTFSRLELFAVDVSTGHLQNPLLTRGSFQEYCITVSAGAAMDIGEK